MEDVALNNKNDNLEESLNSPNSKLSNPYKQVFVIIIIILVCGVFSATFIFFICSEPFIKRRLICIYKINDISKEISVLGNDFENINNSIINIFINHTKINYNKKFKFNESGIYEIIYILNEEINMDNIFKDILSLENVEMYTNGSVKILSMKSAFEGCLNLKNISISGFDFEQLKSISKLFYNTNKYN